LGFDVSFLSADVSVVDLVLSVTTFVESVVIVVESVFTVVLSPELLHEATAAPIAITKKSFFMLCVCFVLKYGSWFIPSAKKGNPLFLWNNFYKN